MAVFFVLFRAVFIFCALESTLVGTRRAHRRTCRIILLNLLAADDGAVFPGALIVRFTRRSVILRILRFLLSGTD